MCGFVGIRYYTLNDSYERISTDIWYGSSIESCTEELLSFKNNVEIVGYIFDRGSNE